MFNYNIYLYRDAEGVDSWYQAVSVIEFQGTLSPNGDSHGHYLCDIKDKITKSWFRTSDDILPIPIRTTEVSKLGYVVLFKRV